MKKVIKELVADVLIIVTFTAILGAFSLTRLHLQGYF